MDYLSKVNISRNLGHRKRKRQTNKEMTLGIARKVVSSKQYYIIDCDIFPSDSLIASV